MKTFLYLAGIFVTAFVNAQPIPMGNPGGTHQFQRIPYGFITTLPPAPPQTEGDYFLQEEWMRGNIVMTDSTMIENVFFRLNMKDNDLELKAEHEIKVLPGRRVLLFVWKDNGSPNDGIYLNAGKHADVRGFMKLVYENTYSLFMQTDFEIVQATYNAALDVGSKNNQIVKKKAWYVCKDRTFMKVERSKKKFLDDLSTFSGRDCRQLFGKQKINPTETDDVILALRTLSGDGTSGKQ